jgi:hypothetical protein
MIDTPGFDDTYRGDEEILRDVAETFADLYKSGITVGAVIYLHRITDVRLQQGALRSISIFREIIGREKYPSLVLATTRWDEIDHMVARMRETELRTQPHFWGGLIRGGATVMSLDNKTYTARQIMDEAISLVSSGPLKIQQEMVTEQRPFKATPAMLALESFSFLTKINQEYMNGYITIPEYITKFKRWMQDAGHSRPDSLFATYGGDVAAILLGVAHTALIGYGVTGAVEGIILSAVAEALRHFFAWDLKAVCAPGLMGRNRPKSNDAVPKRVC